MAIDAEAIARKRSAELKFWRKEIERYEQWFRGELSPLYRTPSPQPHEKIKAPNERHASVLTWHKLHQEAKYLVDLGLKPDAFQGMTLLEIGSGPMPSATCFKDSRLYCLEPLLPEYLQTGFPLHYYGDVTFVHGAAEDIPMQDHVFDAVIAVNAIDHVDDIAATANEIKRVLKPGGRLRMHMHYHQPAVCEPIELDDERFVALFGWCGELRKIRASRSNFSADLPEHQSFVLWSNF